MKRIQDLLEDFANEYGLENKVFDVAALEEFMNLQKTDSSLQKLSAIGVHKGILCLSTKNSMDSFQFIMKKTSIIQTINHKLGKNILKDIKLEIMKN